MSSLQDVENLLRAFSARDLDAIRALADAGVAIDSRGGGSLTALMRAVLRGTPTTAEWLLAAGADPDARADDGKTALDFARDLGRQDLVDLVVQTSGHEFQAAQFRESEKIIEQRFEPCALLDYRIGSLEGAPSFRMRHRLQVFGKQLHVHHDDRQRIFNFVCQ